MTNNERISMVKCEAFDLIRKSNLDADTEYMKGVVDLALVVIRNIEEDDLEAAPSIEPMTFEFKLDDAKKHKINALFDGRGVGE